MIGSRRSFINYRKGELGPQYVRILAEAKDLLIQLEANTPGDVLVMALDFGNGYAGWSPRAAKWESVNNDQLPLTAAHVAVLLLTMPDRLVAWENLFIDCADEYNWNADGYWSDSLCFYFYDGDLRFDARGSDYPIGDYGLAVAFPGSVLGV